MLKYTSFVVLGFVFGLAVFFGFVFFVFNDSDTRVSSLDESNVDDRGIPLTSPNSTSTEDSLADFSSIEQELKSSGLFHRTLTLHNFLSSASIKEQGDLFQLAENIKPTSLRDEIQDTIVRRLSLLKLQAVISLIEQIPGSRRDVLIESAFMEMAIADLDQTTVLALTLGTTQRQSALRGILRGSENFPNN